MLSAITSNDRVNNVHQPLVNNVKLLKMVHDKDIDKFMQYYILEIKC